MRLVILFLVCCAFVLAGNASQPYRNPSGITFTLKRRALEGRHVPFAPHIGNTTFTNWLGMNLDYSLVQPLFDALNSTLNRSLQNRGEAHITIITPPEFDDVLSKANVTMEEINRIALNNKVQESKVDTLCLGRVATRINDLEQEAYQVLVKSHNLQKIRREIFDLYTSNGGEPSHFNPDNFNPHITLGYLHQDLFEQDGVYKGLNACWAKLRVE